MKNPVMYILHGYVQMQVVEKETGHIAYQINAVCEETETS